MKIIAWLKRMFFEKEEDVLLYMQGHDVLPQPLDKKAEEEALIAWENGDEEARTLLIEHNLRLVVYIAKRYETNPIFMEDLISIGSIGLIKAVNTFRRDKNIKLVTYASRCIENEILMFLRKKSRQRLEVSFDEPLNIDYDNNGGIQWDLNPEGIGIQPMMANVTINFTFIGGSDLSGPISRLQNAVSENYYANTSVYSRRADYRDTFATQEDMSYNAWNATFENQDGSSNANALTEHKKFGGN